MAERIQRALPKRMQEISLLLSGAHADIEAVFDYSPDAKLLAADRAVDEWEGADEQEEGDQPRETVSMERSSPTTKARDVVGISHASGVAGMIRGMGESDGGEEIEADEQEFGSNRGSLPASRSITQGILSTSPSTSRARTSGHLTFEPGKSVPSVPRRKMSTGERDKDPSPLEKLYARENTFAQGTGGMGDTVPSWILELNATLRGIETRQRKIESVLDRLNELAIQRDDDDLSMIEE